MSRVRDIANILSGGSSAIATDAEIPANMAGKNKLINGAFDFWQRGTSFTTAGYFADRWTYYGANMGTGSISRVSALGATGIPSDIRYALRYNFTVAGAGYFAQFIEGGSYANGETITISFYARNNGVSAKSFGFEGVQYFGFGGSPSATTVSYSQSAVTINPGASFIRYSVNMAIPSTNGKVFGTDNGDYLAIRFYDIGIANIDFTGFQVETGLITTPFSRAGGDIQGELAKCQRYYYRTNNNDSTAYGVFGFGYSYATNLGLVLVNFPITMRNVPSSFDYQLHGYVNYNNAGRSLTSISVNQSTRSSCWLQYNITGGVQGEPAFAQMNNGSGYLGFSAEL